MSFLPKRITDSDSSPFMIAKAQQKKALAFEGYDNSCAEYSCQFDEMRVRQRPTENYHSIISHS